MEKWFGKEVGIHRNHIFVAHQRCPLHVTKESHEHFARVQTTKSSALYPLAPYTFRHRKEPGKHGAAVPDGNKEMVS